MFSDQVKLPPAHLSSTHGEGFTLSFLLFRKILIALQSLSAYSAHLDWAPVSCNAAWVSVARDSVYGEACEFVEALLINYYKRFSVYFQYKYSTERLK